MKRALLISIVFCLFACTKNNDFPRVETITEGSKWNLEIGTSPADSYGQLQLLSREKNFNSVAIVARTPYSSPEEIQNLINFYNSITLQSNSGVIDRVLIQLVQDKVSSIESGSSLLDSVSKWPQELSDDKAIQINDSTSIVYQKLLDIYQIPGYTNYQIILPDKPLDKPYDTDMANYNEWAFDFSEQIRAEKTGKHSVRLYFENNKLVKIKDEYSEQQMTP